MTSTPLGKGKATAISDYAIADMARSLQCHPADLEAISEVESNGFGWFPDGRIKILFEKHWFYKLIPEAKRANASKSGIARKSWISPKNGGYKDQPDADARYKLLARAIAVDENAAYQSVSIGTYQIMGFNYSACGHKSAKEMFDAFCESEAAQLAAFVAFLRNKGLIKAIQDRDFAQVEKVYNGGGLNGAYATKMRKASEKLRSSKWANWTAQSPKPVVAPTVPEKPKPQPEAPAVAGNWLAALIKFILSLFKRK